MMNADADIRMGGQWDADKSGQEGGGYKLPNFSGHPLRKTLYTCLIILVRGTKAAYSASTAVNGSHMAVSRLTENDRNKMYQSKYIKNSTITFIETQLTVKNIVTSHNSHTKW